MANMVIMSINYFEKCMIYYTCLLQSYLYGIYMKHDKFMEFGILLRLSCRPLRLRNVDVTVMFFTSRRAGINRKVK